MKVKFRSPANRELDDAFDWYESQQAGRGYRFVQAIAKTIERIRMFPDSSPKGPLGSRCALVQGFPYGIWYLHNGNQIEIYAVAQLHREPGYWHNRL